MDTDNNDTIAEASEESDFIDSAQNWSPAVQMMHRSIAPLETPMVLLDASTKVVTYNTPGKTTLQKRGRLLRRRLDHLFPDVNWEKHVGEVQVGNGVVSEMISFQIRRGLERKTQQYHCVFMPLHMPDGLHIMLSLLPIKSAEVMHGPPTSVLLKLRDPLTVIIGHLEMLIDATNLDTNEVNYRLRKIARHAQNIATLLRGSELN